MLPASPCAPVGAVSCAHLQLTVGIAQGGGVYVTKDPKDVPKGRMVYGALLGGPEWVTQREWSGAEATKREREPIILVEGIRARRGRFVPDRAFS